MHQLVVAAPRFLAIAFGAQSFYSFLLVNCGRPAPLVAFRLVFASLFLAVLLAIAGVIGLFAISRDSRHLLRAEFILQDGVRLGLNLLTTALFHPNVIAPLIAPVEYHPPVFILWTIAVLMFAACTFDILFLFLGEYRFPSFLLAVLSSCLILALLIRLAIIRLRSSFHSLGWSLLAIFQLFAMAISAIHLQVPAGALDIVNWFCILLWTTGTSIILLSMFSIDVNPQSTSPKLRPLYLPGRFPHFSVSEDFQSCRDPFAGPLSLSQFPNGYPPPHHSPISLNMKLQDSPHSFRRPRSTPSLRQGYPSFQHFPTSSFQPSKSGTRLESETAYVPSFHPAEAHPDGPYSEEVETPSLQKRLTIHTETSHWSLLPAHLPPSPLENEHLQSQLRSTESPVYISPSKSTVTMAPPPLPIPILKSRQDISTDQTPRQSLYVSNLSPSIAHTSTLDSNRETAEDQMLKGSFSDNNNNTNGEFPSIASLPSIPSFMDTPDHTFTSDYEMSGDMGMDSLVSVEDGIEGSITVVEGGIVADGGILRADENV